MLQLFLTSTHLLFLLEDTNLAREEEYLSFDEFVLSVKILWCEHSISFRSYKRDGKRGTGFPGVSEKEG